MNSSSNQHESIMTTDSSVENSPQKRAKYVKQQPQRDPFDLLTDDAALYPIFEFIGTYHFRFIAGVSRRFRRLYTQFQQEEYRKRVPNADEFEKLITTSITSAASIAESLSRAKVFLKDTSKLTVPFTPILVQKNESQSLIDSLYPGLFLGAKVALRYGQVEILQLAVANGYIRIELLCIKQTCVYAVQFGHLDVLQWLRENDCPWDSDTCCSAAFGGHLDVLQWARENGCPWDKFTCAFAARNGHLDVLQWARENGCPWDGDTCSLAAQGGHLDVLRWARENGCAWDDWTCSYAAKGGHLEVLQWARANGCPWDEKTWVEAAKGGHLEVLQWARANGCPWKEETCDCAAAHGHLDVLQWALGNGCEWNPFVRPDAPWESWPHHVLDWLQENDLLPVDA